MSAQNTPKAARKSTAGREDKEPPENYGETYKTREIRPAVNVPTPRRPVIVGNARHGLAIGQEPGDVRAAVVNFRCAEFAAAQPPAQPSFR